MTYDYLIVGSGLYGSIFAYEANKRGQSCLVIEKRNHKGGNIYTKEIEGIIVHQYGPHIFHHYCPVNEFKQSSKPLTSLNKTTI